MKDLPTLRVTLLMDKLPTLIIILFEEKTSYSRRSELSRCSFRQCFNPEFISSRKSPSLKVITLQIEETSTLRVTLSV